MELKDYIRIISKSWLMILIITLLVTLATVIWSKVQPLKYESGVTLVVNKPNTVPQRAVGYYQYDKFYSIEASSLYADTLTSWLSSAGTAKEIFEYAGLPVPNVSLKKLGRIFKPRRLPPVTIGVTVINKDRERAEKLVKAAVAVVEEKTEEQRRGDDPDHHFAIIAGPTVTAEVRQSIALNSLLGLIAGLIIGLAVAFLREYLKK